MRILVAICIYDRLHNLKRWRHAWQLCDKMGANIVVVHNNDFEINSQYKQLCRSAGMQYFSRENIGFETGVIQDLILNRLKVPKWDVLLFATDDTIPIRRDFLRHYVSELQKPDVGVACMEVSGVWTPHIRTTGWAIKREIASQIKFVHDPISTKEQCYFFEHQGFEDTLMSQVLKMDKRVVQLSNIWQSVMWDTHHTNLDRWAEWNAEFPNFKP